MTARFARHAVLLGAWLAGASVAVAQEPPSTVAPAPAVTDVLSPAAAAARKLAVGLQSNIGAELKKTSAAQIDLSVPDSPAFTVLGLTPEEISRPTAARTLATAILNGVDRNGVLQSGVAVDFIPYLAVYGSRVTLEKYRPLSTGSAINPLSNYSTRFFSRLQMSLATAKASDRDDKAMRAALGFRFTLADFGDPRTDAALERCFDGAITLPDPPTIVAPIAPANDTAEAKAAFERARAEFTEKKAQADAEYAAGVAQFVQTVPPKLQECRNAARQRLWNNTKWIVAFAPSLRSASGSAADLELAGAGYWSTFAYGFDGVPGLDDSMQVLLHARYRSNEQVADSADASQPIVRDGWLVGMQLRGGTPDSSVAFEFVSERNRPEGGAWKNDRRLSLAYEHRLASNLWLGVALGGQAATPDGTSKKGGFLLSSLKWGFAERSSLAAASPN